MCDSPADAQVVSQVERLEEPITAAKIRSLGQNHGVNAKTVNKLLEIYRTGRLARLDSLNADASGRLGALEELTAIWGIGESTANKLIDKGVRSRARLASMLEHPTPQDRDAQAVIATLKPITRRLLKLHDQLQQKIPRDEIEQLGERIRSVAYGRMRTRPLDCKIAGSYRREKDGSTDIDILMIVRNNPSSHGGDDDDHNGLHRLCGPSDAGGGDCDADSGGASCNSQDGDGGRGPKRTGFYKLDQLNELIFLLHEEGILTDDLSHPADETRANLCATKHRTLQFPPFFVCVLRSPLQTHLMLLLSHSGAGNFYMGLCKLGESNVHRRIDVRCFEEHEEAAALFHCTGSGIFIRQVQRVALAFDFQLSEKGLCRAAKQHQDNVMKTSDYIPMRREADIFEALGLVYIEPRDRNGRADVINKETGRCWFEKRRAKVARHSYGAIDGPMVSALPAPRLVLEKLAD